MQYSLLDSCNRNIYEKELYFILVDQKKAFDCVPRVKWAIRKLGTEKWLVRVVMAMYEGATIQMWVNGGLSVEFSVNVIVHKGSVFCPLLIIMILEALPCNLRTRLSWEVM